VTRETKLLWIGLLVGWLVGSLAACASGAHTFSGVMSEPPQAARDFTLIDETGNPFRLSDLKGRWVLLAFGYTSCPDVCPLTLAHLRSVKTQIASADQVAVVFVSVDPERDTPDIMLKYVRHFGEDFKGLTGAKDQIDLAVNAYGAKYEIKKDEAESAAGYTVSHSAFVYLIDPQFQLRLTFPFGVTPKEIVSDLTYLMSR